ISWGGPNLIRAERRLLAAALADPANQRFVLLSESYATPLAPAALCCALLALSHLLLHSLARCVLVCVHYCRAPLIPHTFHRTTNYDPPFLFPAFILPPPTARGGGRCVPLFNFSHVYDYLFASPTSFITSHPSEWRYQPGMAPTVNRSQFRKGSQVGAVRGGGLAGVVGSQVGAVRSGGLAGGRCEEWWARSEVLRNEVRCSEVPRFRSLRTTQAWFALTRRHADMVVADTHVYDAFLSNHAMPLLPASLSSAALPLLLLASTHTAMDLAPPCSRTMPCLHPTESLFHPSAAPRLQIPDESYIQMLLLMQDPGGVEPRGVTFLHWQPTAGRHPLTITPEQLTPDFLRSIQRTRLPPKEAIGFLRVPAPRLCQLAGRPTHCFLFARKFNASAIPALLALSPALGF
ncbi:unnamed protein product, partial [Closterium sp. Naga37s-1]